MAHYDLLPKETLEELYFQRGKSLQGVADAAGTTNHIVRLSFHAHGLKWRNRSQSLMGREYSPETREKIAAFRRGRKDSVTTRAKKVAALTGRPGWNKGLTAGTDERMRKLREATESTMRTKEWRARASKAAASRIAKGGDWKRGYHDSPKAGRVYYMSSWEEQRWRELDCDPLVEGYQVYPLQIPYLWEGSERTYTPDVLITLTDGSKVLEEIKPAKQVSWAGPGGQLTAKIKAGEAYAALQGWGWRLFSY